MSKNQGFTLIELMIVVAIVGILAAIAVPSYQNYTKRAAAAELVQVIAPVKAAISEYAVVNAAFPADASTGGWTDPAGGNVSSVSYAAATGVFSITGTAATGSLTLDFTPTITASGVTWTCTSSANQEYAPASCR